jgi:phage repressor protein C with HTH and peptisase S24 domain
MGWAKPQVDRLKNGETVSFRPTGNSMTPKIHSGDLVTVSPDIEGIKKGEIVLCKCSGRYFCHLVSAVQGERYQISNNHGQVNGWIGKSGIFGRVIKVES